MSKRTTYLTIIIIFFLAFLAGNFSEPQYFNRGVDYINLKFEILNFKFKLPNFPEKPFKLGLDLQGGVHLVYQADLSGIEEKDKGKVMDGLRDLIERRINLFGVREPVVQVQRERLIVELSGQVDPAKAVEEIGKTPFLEFREEKENFQEIIEKNKKVAETGQGTFEDPFKPTLLTGRYLKRAELGFDQVTSKSLVSGI